MTDCDGRSLSVLPLNPRVGLSGSVEGAYCPKPDDAMIQALESDRELMSGERSSVRLRASICSRSAAIHSTSDPWGTCALSPQEGQVGVGSESRRPLRLTPRRASSVLRSSTAVSCLREEFAQLYTSEQTMQGSISLA
jgi:hypothetical protein